MGCVKSATSWIRFSKPESSQLKGKVKWNSLDLLPAAYGFSKPESSQLKGKVKWNALDLLPAAYGFSKPESL